jgi:hypothetical protein
MNNHANKILDILIEQYQLEQKKEAVKAIKIKGYIYVKPIPIFISNNPSPWNQ